MKYVRKKMQAKLNELLLNEKLKDVFYYSEYPGFESFNSLSGDVQEVYMSPILLETHSGKFISFVSSDYLPILGYTTGIGISDKIKEPYERPSHVNEERWNPFRDAKITKLSIIESSETVRDERVTLPFGVKLEFGVENTLFIFDLTVENFSEKENRYEFCRNGETTIFFSEDVTVKQNVFSLFDH